uniref:Uncharacterized protein n=1 Tax=Arundo donax TaxID=35708 RepID=A0A0A8Z0G3_ARUDO
MLTQWAAALS